MSIETLTLSELIDSWHTTRTNRLALQKQVEALEEAEKNLKAKIMEGMTEAGLTAAGGQLLRVSLETEYQPTITDFGALSRYIKSHDAFELLHRRVNSAAVKERWDAGEEVDGVGKFPVPKLKTSVVKKG